MQDYQMEVRWAGQNNSETHHCENDDKACSIGLSLAARYPLGAFVDIYRMENGKKVFVNTAEHCAKLMV